MKRNVYLILITVITILCIIAGTGYHLVRFGLSVAEGLPSFSEFIEAISDWDDEVMTVTIVMTMMIAIMVYPHP